jgi:hypothetical protein
MEESPRARHWVPKLTLHKLASIRVRFDEDLQSNSLNFDYTSKEGINCAHSSSIKGSFATASVEAANVWYYLIMWRLIGKLINNNEKSYLVCLVIARSLVQRPPRSCFWCEYVKMRKKKKCGKVRSE